MSRHRIDLAIHDGMLAIITLTFGQSLEADEALLLREDTLDRLDRIAGALRRSCLTCAVCSRSTRWRSRCSLGLEERSRRYANLVDLCHVVRHTPELDALMQAQLCEGERPAPMFETCAEAVGF